jgi:hyperosmotically inducible periplasmic protein
MKTLPNHSRVVLAAAVLTVLFASGCERRTPTDTTGAPSGSPAAGVSSPPAAAPEAAPASPSVAAPSDTAGASKTPGTIIDDTVITTKVKTALLADSDIKGLDVNVATSKGVVTLNGAVNNQAQIDRAAKIASGVEGVGSVANNLTIKKE